MAKETEVELSSMHLAMVYRYAGEQPPADIDQYRGYPTADTLGVRLAYMRRHDPQGEAELAKKLGYGMAGHGPMMKVSKAWLLSMLSKGTSALIEARVVAEPEPEIGPDGQDEQERLAREFADLWREGASRWQEDHGEEKDLSPPEL